MNISVFLYLPTDSVVVRGVPVLSVVIKVAAVVMTVVVESDFMVMFELIEVVITSAFVVLFGISVKPSVIADTNMLAGTLLVVSETSVVLSVVVSAWREVLDVVGFDVMMSEDAIILGEVFIVLNVVVVLRSPVPVLKLKS